MTHTRTAEFRFPWNDQWEATVKAALAAWSAKVPSVCPAHGEPTEANTAWRPHNDYGSPPGFRDVEFHCIFEPCPVCRLARAGFQPVHQRCSFENFVADTPELKTNIDKCREFAAAAAAGGGGFLLLLGKCGTGKSHLAASLVRTAGFGHCYRHSEVISRHRASYGRAGRDCDPEEQPEDIAETCRNARLLVIDELGLALGGNDADLLLFNVLDYRVGHFRPTVLCGNIPAGELSAHFGDRLADRFRHALFAVLNFTGPSRRRDLNAAYHEAARRHQAKKG